MSINGISNTHCSYFSIEQVSNSLNKIWKVFVDRLRSCLTFLRFSFDFIFVDREFRLIRDESRIAERLTVQKNYAKAQMQAESSKNFKYQAAPQTCERHEEKVGEYQVGISHAQGRRPTMEDEHLAVAFDLKIEGRVYPIRLFGIFDGHGGKEASKYIRDHLRAKLEEALIEFNSEGLSEKGIWKALKLTTARISRDFKHRFGRVADEQGSTATIAMILDQNIWTANVGDSRIVLDNNGVPMQLTEDAKPDNPRYRKWIEERGGRVRVNGVARINGDLAVARAIGDFRLGAAITARSKITRTPLSEVAHGSHLVLCCDGIYDVASTREVVSAVHRDRHLTAAELAANITYSAYASESGDNLSAMVIKIL